jgi:hypothetical protein
MPTWSGYAMLCLGLFLVALPIVIGVVMLRKPKTTTPVDVVPPASSTYRLLIHRRQPGCAASGWPPSRWATTALVLGATGSSAATSAGRHPPR